MPLPYQWRDTLMHLQERFRPSALKDAVEAGDWKEKVTGSFNKDSIKPKNLRRTINENSIIISAALGIIILIALFYMWRSTRPPSYTPIATDMTFVDDVTGEPTVIRSTPGVAQMAPLANKDGKNTLVLAIYFTCDDCKTKNIAYLQKYTDEAKSIADKLSVDSKQPGLNEEAFMKIQDGLLVRLPEKGSPWVKSNSPDGFRIVTGVKCPNGSPPHFNSCQ